MKDHHFVAPVKNFHTDAIQAIFKVGRKEEDGWIVWTGSSDSTINVLFVPAAYSESLVSNANLPITPKPVRAATQPNLPAIEPETLTPSVPTPVPVVDTTPVAPAPALPSVPAPFLTASSSGGHPGVSNPDAPPVPARHPPSHKGLGVRLGKTDPSPKRPVTDLFGSEDSAVFFFLFLFDFFRIFRFR